MSDAPLLLHVAASLAFVAVAGRGIGWALDAWVGLARGEMSDDALVD
ncbi:hypothetical protein OPKNFCMD_0777 [Methylobacterium crusticola]|uniref:Uncharacterized protein n=1 Tax=Methylobacterium crusticola TaxID=1697972 RepID=A0ABQ4QRV3_9HYPH|nr:hypothetical protein [Methylobacterium crusticola]GJD48061.1 hypothetical protein OPKNFCMD_0777 [Methylobacterium crusticola]